MSKTKMFYCIVDDTALITNISEIEAWVLRRAIALVVPLHTLERLHLLKKDTSQIGQNARKAVKFLDDATSNTDVTVLIQEPDDQYPTWAQVEAHYAEAKATTFEQKENVEIVNSTADDDMAQKITEKINLQNGASKSNSDDQISQMTMSNLTISKGANASPMSTPPLSPSSSAKTSPEVKSATIITHDLSPVPPSLKALINSVVWYTYEKSTNVKDIVFLTNSSDTAYLARDFGVASKNIHQLRTAIGVEEQEVKNHNRYQKKHGAATVSKTASEPETLFRYEEDDSEEDEEEVVFKPRGKAANKTVTTPRGGSATSTRAKAHGHSPATSLSGPPQPILPKPQVPVEEIDPDSFDRGSFARGSTPLVSVGNQVGTNFNGPIRSPGYRGNHTGGGPSRGSNHRGPSRGVERGSARGRGRLFVP